MKEWIAGISAALVILLIAFLIFSALDDEGPFDYQRVAIIGGDVIITIFNDDVDVPLRAHFFAEQQAKKHNAYFLGYDSSISIRWTSWGWSWGKGKHQREEYTYHYKFYYKKRGNHEKISN